MRNRLITAIGLIALALAVVAAPFGPRAAADPPLCGSMAGAAPHITKVLWVVMENQSYGSGTSQIPGSASDPYIKNTLSTQCGTASNFHATTHPSYPNYLALTSGSAQNHYSDSLGYFTGPSIFSQADPSWRGYEEFMPTNCDHVFQTGTAPPSQYYLGRHNPAASYSSMPIGAPSSGDCTTNDVPMGTTTAGALHDDAASGSLPAFSMVTPGLCNDMHGLPAGDTSCPDPIKGGDDWLATWIPILAASPDYTSGHLLIDVVWDEGHGGSSGDDCITMNVTSCIVPNVVISPYTTPVVASADYSHYSLLKTTEELLGVPLLGHAADPTTEDLCGPYGICPALDQPPTASFTSSCNGLSCHFDGSASTASGGPVASYSWSYGDAVSDAGVTVDHDYAAAGSYPVSLTVTDATGRVATTTQQLDVSDVSAAPIAFVAATGAAGTTSASVTVPEVVDSGDVMVLTASAATTDPAAAPAGWTRVGDQASSVIGTSVWTKVATAGDPGSAVTVTYPAAKKSTLQLAAYSGVDPDSPVAAFAGAGSHVTTSSAATPGVTVPAAGDWVVSSWSVKSSSVTAWRPPTGSQPRTTVIGTGGGRISSLVADPGGPAVAGPAGGVSASTDQPFAAAVTTSLVLAQAACATDCTPPPPPPPVAAFTASCTGWSCGFDGSASTATGGSIADYAWSFGDGATGSGIAPSHAYPADGDYPVSLTVTDSSGGQASVTHTETVAAAPPPPPATIGFVAAIGTTKNSATETVTVPAAVTEGDGLVLVATEVRTGTLSAPPGWRLETSEPNAVMTTSVWSKVATGSDAGSPITVRFPAQVKGSLQLLAYSGTSLGDPVAAVGAAASRTSSTTAVTPSVGVPDGGWLVSYWAAKSSAVSSWTTAAATARNSAIGTGGGQISALLADSDGALPAGTAGGLTATANQPFGSAVTLSIALAPLG